MKTSGYNGVHDIFRHTHISSISRCESLDGPETPGPSLRRGQLLSQGGLHRLGGPRPAALGRRADQETQARGETKWGNILGYSK